MSEPGSPFEIVALAPAPRAARPALAPVEYALAVAGATFLSDVLGAIPLSGSWVGSPAELLVTAIRDGALGGAALGFLAHRTERAGRPPGVLALLVLALLVRVLWLASLFVPTPWDPPGRAFASADLGTNAAVTVPIPAIACVLGWRLALAARGHWSEGLRLALPLTLGDVASFGTFFFYVGADGLGSFALGEVLSALVLSLALPVLARLVPTAFRALGIHTRGEPDDQDPGGSP